MRSSSLALMPTNERRTVALSRITYTRNNYSSRLEEDPFPSGGGPTADYAFMLFFGAVVLWVRLSSQFVLPHTRTK